MNHMILAASIGLAIAVAAPTARAGLLNSSVRSEYYSNGGPYPFGGLMNFQANGVANEVATSGIVYFSVAVSDSQIIYDFSRYAIWSDSPKSLSRDGLTINNGNLLTFAGALGITNVEVNAATNMDGFSSSNVSFNGNEIAVNWENLTFYENTVVVLDVSTVPEPSTYVLVLAGLGAIASAARARRRLGN